MSAQVIQLSDRRGQKPSSLHRPTEEEIRSVLYDCWSRDPLWYRTALAHRLRLLREALKNSEQEAAKAMGVAVRTYRRYERAERTQPNHFGFKDFAETYGVSLNWLMGCGGPVLRNTLVE
jgi:hypothetical protein